MIFFSVQKFLKGNLKGSFVVKVFLMGITILDRRILFVKFWLWRALKVESRPSDLPPRYVLIEFVLNKLPPKFSGRAGPLWSEIFSGRAFLAYKGGKAEPGLRINNTASEL